MDRGKSAYVETYGCQMNISDGELMSGILEGHGYRLAPTPEEADVILVNTCAIREHAETRVLGRVAQLSGLKEANPDLILGVTGCMAERMGQELLQRAPQVDLVMGPDGYRYLADALDGMSGEGTKRLVDAAAAPGPSHLVQLEPRRKGERSPLAVLGLDPTETYEGLARRRTSEISAWVPIQRGCDHRCTFCIVPSVRGREKNRPPKAVLEEIHRLAAGGTTEVTLLGQTVNSYQCEDWGFPRLLREVAGVPGIHRVRFTSPHPNDVSSELVEVMAEEEAVCEQLHLPLQAGNDRTLKRMLRRHTTSEFLAKVDLVRGMIPGIALSTDVIVAFPGETEDEFRDTLSLLEHIRFDEAFTYRYSPREGTPATRFPPDQAVPEAVGKARLEALIELTRGIQKEINQGEVGRIEEVLVEKEGKERSFMLGRTRRNKVVVFPGGPDDLGTYRRVELASTTGATFSGRRIEADGNGEAD